MTLPITHYRPGRRGSRLAHWLTIAPGLMLAGAAIGHLIEAAAR